MRLGKPVEHLQAALKAALSSAPAPEQITTIGRQLGYFGYLTYDAIVWVRGLFHSRELCSSVLRRLIQSNS